MTAARALYIERSPGEARWALSEAGEMVELGVERARAGAQPGDIHLARVRKLVPSAGAAIVDLGGDLQGFLPAREARRKTPFGDGDGPGPRAETDDISKLVTEGEALLVQVRRPAFEKKAAQVSASVTLPGARLVLAPAQAGVTVSREIADEAERARLTEAVEGALAPALGAILRTAAAEADAATLADEAARLEVRWREVADAARTAKAPAALARDDEPVTGVLRELAAAGLDRIELGDRSAIPAARDWCAAMAPELAGLIVPAGDDRPDLDAAFEAALDPRVALPGGGALTLEPTAALVAIDVDTGGRPARGQDRAILETNLAAAAEAGRQIRRRNLAGLIAIDFVRMRARADRDRVLAALKEAMAGDRLAPEVGGFTRFGLVEIVRRRAKAALHEAMMVRTADGGWRLSPETQALAGLRALLREAGAHPGRPPVLRAGPAVLAVLQRELAGARAEAEARLGMPVALDEAGETGGPGFDISFG